MLRARLGPLARNDQDFRALVKVVARQFRKADVVAEHDAQLAGFGFDHARLIAGRVVAMLEVRREHMDLAIRSQHLAALEDPRRVEHLIVVGLDRATDDYQRVFFRELPQGLVGFLDAAK